MSSSVKVCCRWKLKKPELEHFSNLKEIFMQENLLIDTTISNRYSIKFDLINQTFQDMANEKLSKMYVQNNCVPQGYTLSVTHF